MAEVIRIAESASEAATPTLPQNVEAEAALLGALMIDNRLVEDIQLKLKPDHFFEPLHGRIYDAILKLTDSNRIANPVTLKPLFEADEGMKEVGGPAYLAQLTGSGAAVIGARDFATQIYDLALLRALVGVGRELVEGALDTSEDVAPLAQIERAESELYKVAEEGGAEGKAINGQRAQEAVRAFAPADHTCHDAQQCRREGHQPCRAAERLGEMADHGGCRNRRAVGHVKGLAGHPGGCHGGGDGADEIVAADDAAPVFHGFERQRQAGIDQPEQRAEIRLHARPVDQWRAQHDGLHVPGYIP